MSVTPLCNRGNQSQKDDGDGYANKQEGAPATHPARCPVAPPPDQRLDDGSLHGLGVREIAEDVGIRCETTDVQAEDGVIEAGVHPVPDIAECIEDLIPATGDACHIVLLLQSRHAIDAEHP